MKVRGLWIVVVGVVAVLVVPGGASARSTGTAMGVGGPFT